MGTIIKGKTVIGPNIVTDGLELLLDAGSDRSYPGSGAVYYDLSGGGNNGVIYGATHNSLLPAYFTYDSTSERVVIPSTFFDTPPTTMSMSSWFNMTGGGGTYRCILHKNATASPTSVGGSTYWIGVSAAGNLVATIGAAYVGWAGGDTGIIGTLNKWWNVGASWDGSIVRVYVNGQYIKQYNLPTYVTGTAVTRLGSSSDSGAYQVIGDISNTYMYYNNVLSDEDFLQNYNAQKSRFVL